MYSHVFNCHAHYRWKAFPVRLIAILTSATADVPIEIWVGMVSQDELILLVSLLNI